MIGRNARIIDLYSMGAGLEAIAAELNTPLSTVGRVIFESRDAIGRAQMRQAWDELRRNDFDEQVGSGHDRPGTGDRERARSGVAG